MLLFAGKVIDATGEAFSTIIVMCEVCIREPESVTVSVITCVPIDNEVIKKNSPVPIIPSMLDDQTRLEPGKVSSSASVPVPEKTTGLPNP